MLAKYIAAIESVQWIANKFVLHDYRKKPGSTHLIGPPCKPAAFLQMYIVRLFFQINKCLTNLLFPPELVLYTN